jgi:hypothetical protein
MCRPAVLDAGMLPPPPNPRGESSRKVHGPPRAGLRRSGWRGGPGIRVEGVYRQAVDLASGRFAVIEKSREFTLVPWRSVLERHIGRAVAGIPHGDDFDRTIGRGRGGPSLWASPAAKAHKSAFKVSNASVCPGVS